MSLKSAILLAAAIFLVTVLVRLPAAVITLFLPSAVQCQTPAGTIWRGACGELRSGATALADVQWTLHPLALLRAQLCADVSTQQAGATGRAKLWLHVNGDLDIQALQASLPSSAGLGLLPAGWDGTLELAIEQASLRRGHLATLQGVVRARQVHRDQPPADFGGFELTFPQAASLVGSVRDLDGPLSLQGVLRLSRSGSYEFAGTVAARAGAGSDLQQLLQLLGPADAQGRRALSLSGTL